MLPNPRVVRRRTQVSANNFQTKGSVCLAGPVCRDSMMEEVLICLFRVDKFEIVAGAGVLFYRWLGSQVRSEILEVSTQFM